MTGLRPPLQPRPAPAARRSLKGDVAAFLLIAAVIALLSAPVYTIGVVIGSVAGLWIGKRGARTLARRLDGRSRSVRFPGLGTLDLRFSTH